MTENVENIVLEQLRHIRNDLKTHSSETKEQLAWLHQRLSSVEHSTALIHAAQADLVTKRDLKDAVGELKTEMSIRFERVEGELKLNRWMLGLLLAGVLALILKTFF